MPAYKKLRSDILKVLMEHPSGKPIHVDVIVSKTGFSPEQVKASMNNMIKDGLPVEVISRANVWKYTGEDTPETTTAEQTTNHVGELWEVVGMIKTTGEILIRDENGYLYRATEME